MAAEPTVEELDQRLIKFMTEFYESQRLSSRQLGLMVELILCKLSLVEVPKLLAT